MLQYNATQYFITEYDRVASTYPPNNTLLTQSIKYNNQRVFDHLLSNTNMSIPMKYGGKDIYTDVITAVVTSGNMYMLQTFFDMTGHGIIRSLKRDQLMLAINHNEHFVRLLLQHTTVHVPVTYSINISLSRRAVCIDMLRLLNEEFAAYRLLADSTWMKLAHTSLSWEMAESVEYLLDHIPASLTSRGWRYYIRDSYINGNVDTLKVIFYIPMLL
ncbi:hypothetical protein SAMD00019534_113720 [Acytostelium subglobosum LB1]|uniref:hypothetical protein n=1 Tax=Acytostelium subglobosum LB1 TaxID=1410327 RepID=UPI0006449510|nr:hypothetical protein SAMD00019534_113720 [Acytostelium subglobosum LB1]GAM28196.1 hypothetical protein SAMD00019534_113720 [Acytostelium subglobosum LB1]|eukprot:XP_012748830.1 hypothetical protein SAMD00019534_113720 [Acytostelium subglobosum LB1]